MGLPRLPVVMSQLATQSLVKFHFNHCSRSVELGDAHVMMS